MTPKAVELQQTKVYPVSTNRHLFPKWIWGIVVIQFAGLLVWSIIKWHDFSYTYDFAIYYQAAYLIAHGSLNPFSTVLGFPFIQNDFELIMWPVGWLLAIVHSGFLLPVLQDLALSLTTGITLLWSDDIIMQYFKSRDRAFDAVGLRVLAMVLIIGTPWIYWAASFDFHIEPLVLPFVVLAARSFWKDAPRAGYFWTAMFLLGGNVAATYAAGIAVMELLRGRKHLLNGVALIAISGAALLGIEKLVPGGIRGGNLTTFYGYLALHVHQVTAVSVVLGMIAHPLRAARVLWFHRLNLIGEISPAGLIGAFSPMSIGITTVVLLTDNLISGVSGGHAGLMFGDPQYFQGITVIPFVVVGTIFLLARIRHRFKRQAVVFWYSLVAALLINTGIWFTTFLPEVSSSLVNISTSASSVLSQIRQKVFPFQEVVSTLAFVGRFAGRSVVSTFMSDGSSIPVTRHRVVFIVSPYQGTEASAVNVELARIWNIAHLNNVKLLNHGHGIWAFSWESRRVGYNLNLANLPQLYPAWALHHPSGLPVLDAHIPQWHIASTGKEGYLVDGFYRRLVPGSYSAMVRLSTTGPVNVEVWDATGSTLLKRATIPSTSGYIKTIKVAFLYNKVLPHLHFFRGYGLWQVTPPPPSSLNQIELRIWTAGTAITDVYGVNIRRISIKTPIK